MSVTWYGIITTITKLTELDDFTIDSCANTLNCKFERSDSNRYRSDALQGPFEDAEFIPGSDKMILTLTLMSTSPREEYAKRGSAMGRPIDVDIVSPPVADDNTQQADLNWDRKLSLCYEFGDCRVWFGIEETVSQKRLVSITLKRQLF